MISLIIRLGLLCCSFFGYILFLHKKGIEIAFAPVLTCIGIGLSMFVAGILNLMPQMVFILFFSGLVLFGLMTCAFFQKQLIISTHEWVVLSFFFIFFAFMALRLRGTYVWAFHNYSHWLTVIKAMVHHNAMPNFNTQMVRFQSYPTGTAGFIYYIAKILGEGDDIYLFGQSILYISSLSCFWVYAKKNHLLSALIILPTSLFLLTYNNQIDDLCVDTMLGLLGIAGFAILVYYRSNLELASILSCLLSSYLILVKNSGVFFVIVHFILLLALYLRTANDVPPIQRCKLVFKLTAIDLGVPLLLFYIWMRHVDYVYVDGTSSLHTMDLGQYASELTTKTDSAISGIFSSFGRWVLTLNTAKYILLLLCAMYLVVYVVKKYIRHEDASNDFRLLIWSLFCCILYSIGLLAMYLLSMGSEKAIALAAIERYFGTFVQYLVGISTLYVLHDIEQADSVSVCRRLAACILILFSLFSTMDRIPFFFHNTRDYSQTARYNLRNIMDEYGIPEESSYYILYNESAFPADEDGLGRFRFVSQYELWTYGFFIDTAPDPQKALENPNSVINHDYLIVMYEDETVDQFIEALGLTPGERAYYLGSLRPE